jgi:hypothetical protein
MLAQANRSWTDDIYFSFLLPARLPGLDSRTSLASSGDSAREALYRRLERQRDLDWWQTLALAALLPTALVGNLTSSPRRYCQLSVDLPQTRFACHLKNCQAVAFLNSLSKTLFF